MLAQNLNNVKGGAGGVTSLESIQNKAGLKLPSTLGGVIGSILPYVFGLAGILLLVYLVLGGLQLMTSKGDPKAVEAAKEKITNALIGFVIVLISIGVVALLGKVLNIQVFGTLF